MESRLLSAQGTPIICVVLFMHLTQAIILLVDDHSVGGIALSTMLDAARLVGLNGPYPLGIVMLSFAACTVAALGVTWPHPLIRVSLMLPQQALLTIAAYGAAQAIIKSSYADGVLRSSGFILADQLPLFVLLGTHTIAMVRRAQDRRA